MIPATWSRLDAPTPAALPGYPERIDQAGIDGENNRLTRCDSGSVTHAQALRFPASGDT